MFKIRWNSVRDAFQSVEGKGFNVAYAGETVATSVIVFGAFILFMALLGMVGAMCEVRLLLTLVREEGRFRMYVCVIVSEQHQCVPRTNAI